MKRVVLSVIALFSVACSFGGIVSVYPTVQNQFENIGQVNVPVFLNVPDANATSVNVQLVLSGTTATRGVDFLFSDTTITWQANAYGTIQVPIMVINDNVYEFSETVLVKITNVTNGATIADSTMLLTIYDNDPLTGANCSDLFFSEYIEGTGNNKALEIFNPTAYTVDLSDYRVFKSNNGGALTDVFGLSGILAPGDVYVMANAAPNVNSTIISKADTISFFFDFNGNDALALLHLNDTIEVIGQPGVDPGGSGWPIDSTGSTENHTLIRNPYTYRGSKNWNIAMNDWRDYSVDMFDSLGGHKMAACGSTEPLPPAVVQFISNDTIVPEGVAVFWAFYKIYNPSGQIADYVVAQDGGVSTAINGLDFAFTNEVRHMGPGLTIDSVRISIMEDELIEPTEHVLFRFINLSSNVIIGPDSLYNLSISDTDKLHVSFNGSGYSYREDSGLVRIRLVLSSPVNNPVTVKIKLAPGNAEKGADFLFNDTMVVFPPNSTDTQAVWVTILEDSLNEGNEQINFDLADPTGGAIMVRKAFTLTIIDNDTVETGIGEIYLAATVKMFPNPVTSRLTLETITELKEVNVVDLLGNRVMSQGNLSEGKNTIDVTALPPGMYFITAVSNGQLLGARFIKAD